MSRSRWTGRADLAQTTPLEAADAHPSGPPAERANLLRPPEQVRDEAERAATGGHQQQNIVRRHLGHDKKIPRSALTSIS